MYDLNSILLIGQRVLQWDLEWTTEKGIARSTINGCYKLLLPTHPIEHFSHSGGLSTTYCRLIKPSSEKIQGYSFSSVTAAFKTGICSL
jgi:hypothetical protein